jgi:dTDP-4-amino-4,6-dideoxygalactose transaminase
MTAPGERGSVAARHIPLNNLAPGIEAMQAEIEGAIRRVLERGWFILGPECEAFEQAFAAYHGPGFQAVGVASGTDALRIGLQALGIQPGDEVLVVANAGVPPVAAVVAAGARPVFCDVDPHTHMLDPAEISKRAGPKTRAVLVVHLFGRVAAMDVILAQARAHGLAVLEDCAQAHGACYRGQLAGTWGDAAAFSFYPTKNLGALGDGGAVLARNAEIAERARLLRNYGWRQQYHSELHSTNSRLDELQAAVLLAKLPRLDGWNRRRRELASLYCDELTGLQWVTPPADVEPGSEHIYHLFVIRAGGRRDELKRYLAEHGTSSGVHYPLPAHLQTPYACYGLGAGSLPHTEQLASEVLSLPMYPELSADDVRHVAGTIRSFAG